MALIIGKITKAQGIKGEVKVIPITDDALRFNKLKTAIVDGREYAVQYARVIGPDVFLKFVEVVTRNDAELLANKFISVERDDAVQLTEYRWFIADLIGSAVFVEDKPIGTLIDILQNSKVDVYVVSGDNKKEIMFPALKDLLKTVDTEHKKIILDKKRFGEVAVIDDEV